jgi:hypothetical protein
MVVVGAALALCLNAAAATPPDAGWTTYGKASPAQATPPAPRPRP